MRLQPDATTGTELARYLAAETEDTEPADSASFSVHARRAFVAFHLGEYGQAARQMEQARKLSRAVHAPPPHAELYDGLTRVMMDPTLKKPALKENRRAIRAVIKNLERRAALGPADYAPQWRLLEAELARLEGRGREADDHYEAAIAAARQAGSVHEEALANELAGRCYLARGKTRIARLYLSEARALYARWGAARKVRWLDETYAPLDLAPRGVIDPLTGLCNRGYLETTLANELALAQRRAHPVSLVMIDIDNLKHINGHWGPEAGDEVLRHVARTIRDSCRDTDVVARDDGGGFAVILSGTDTEQALHVAERIRGTLAEQPLAVAGNRVPVTVSLGFATYSEKRNESKRLISAADEALYRAKAAGRNRLMEAV